MITKLQETLLTFGRDTGEIARKLGVSEGAVDALMYGGSLSVAQAKSVSQALKISLGQLLDLRKNDETSELSMFFRQSSGVKSFEVLSELQHYENLVDVSAEFLGDPDTAYEWVGKYYNASLSDVEAVAEDVRENILKVQDMTPLHHIEDCLSRIGVRLFVVSSKQFEGASLVHNHTPYIFVSPRFTGRMLFTICHELSHLLVHARPNSEYIKFEEYEYLRQPSISNVDDERLADSLASSILLPRKGVGLTLRTIRQVLNSSSDSVGDVEILYLAFVYGVSFEVAGYRLEKLGIIPAGSTFSLAERIRREYGSAEKRAASADINLPARPSVDLPLVPADLLREAVKKVAEGTESIGYVKERLGVSISNLMRHNAQEV